MRAPKHLYRLDEDLKPVERLPIGNLSDFVSWDDDDFYRLYVCDCEDEEDSNYIDLFVRTNGSRIASHHFAEAATVADVQRIESWAKTKAFIDLASTRWGSFIVEWGAADREKKPTFAHAELTIYYDEEIGFVFSECIHDDPITYQRLIDDFNIFLKL